MKAFPGAASLCVLLVLVSVCRAVMAEQAIDIRFSKDPSTGQEIIKARGAFSEHGKALRQILVTFHRYAELHPWITETTVVNHALSERMEVLVRFKFPWPVGRRWSRIVISTDADTAIAWHQLDGSLKSNRGHLKFVVSGESVDIDYSAAIDVGLPDAWTRSFKKRFVTEFMAAAWSRATAGGGSALKLAGAATN